MAQGKRLNVQFKIQFQPVSAKSRVYALHHPGIAYISLIPAVLHKFSRPAYLSMRYAVNGHISYAVLVGIIDAPAVKGSIGKIHPHLHADSSGQSYYLARLNKFLRSSYGIMVHDSRRA